jgi:hypothetical protein
VENRLGVFENRVQRIYGQKREELRRLHNEELHNL